MSTQGGSRRNSGSGQSRRGGDTPRGRATSRLNERASKDPKNSRATSGATKPGAAGRTPAKTDGAGTGSSTRPGQKVAATPARRAVGMVFTWRAIILVVVLFILLLSYANSLRVYYRQQQQMAEARVQIEQHQREIATLEDEKARWADPNYVKAQARSRLGWVMPGEIGYKVIGPDGKPLGGGTELETTSQQPDGEYDTWWKRLVGSVRTADDPAPAEQTPTAPPTVKVSTPAPTPGATKVGASPSPTPSR
ncbi:FtsB family cell division protein [Propionibacteriaceae bacterium G57]|uniref:FtsB family cell division protein n=1 Tax=Aestuariimicrobium sp. G57 TaxID=3418485 RepID=UPI003DA758E2